MKRETYREMSKTAEGRHEVHEMMLVEIKTKIDNLVANAPAANREKAAALMEGVFAKIKNMGNRDLFDAFADEYVDTITFVANLQLVKNGEIW